MAHKDGIEPVTALKTKSAELIRKTRETRRPILITQNGRATAVLQDIDSFQKQRDALLLLKLFAQGDRELREGDTMSEEGVSRELEAHLDRLSRG